MPSDTDRTKVRHPSPVLDIGVPRASSRPTTPEDLPFAAADDPPPLLPQSVSAAGEKPKVRLPEDANQPKSGVASDARLPLLVDLSQLPFDRACRCGTLADAARVPPVANPSGLFADPLVRESLPGAPLRNPVHWPKIVSGGGGATCSGPRNSGHNMPNRNKLGHEPMGKVTLLGASLRPLQSARGPPPRASLAVSGDTVEVESSLEENIPAVDKVENQGKVEAALLSDRQEVPRDMQNLTEDELQAGVGLCNPGDGGQSIMEPSAATAAAMASLATPPSLATMGQSCQFTPQVPKEVTASPSPKRTPKTKHAFHLQGTSETSQPQAEQTSERPFVSKAVESDKGEICLPTSDETVATEPQLALVQALDMHPAVVGTCEVALQTDALPTELARHGNVKFTESAAEHQRILILRCCDRRQVDFARWTPSPKAEAVLSPEMRYLRHVRHRFPGTIVGGCLSTKASDRRSKHVG